jgi:aminoglycoside 6'-N-acetyltransferase I
MRVRPIEVPDIVIWAAMRKRLWPDADLSELAAETRAYVVDVSTSMLDAAFIAEAENAETLGFIELSIRAFSDGCDSMPVPHVEGWYVEPAARGHGVGRALLRAAEDWARARGFTELASDTETHNVDSQAAHAKCGFEEVDRIVKFRKTLRPVSA